MWTSGFKNFFLELLFPKFCLGCQKEGNYLCEDCQSTLGISGGSESQPSKNLKELHWALPYRNPLVKNLIQKFKYEPFVRELAKTLTSLIINHFQLIDKKPDFFNFTPHHFLSNGLNQKKSTRSGAGFILIPVPLEKNKMKWRGFNQTQELGKELSDFLKIPLILNCLAKIKETLPQVELSDEEREVNILGAFSCQNPEKIQGRKILLVDDIYTTGSTMEECARVLKEAGVKEVIGIVVARAEPGKDQLVV